MESKRLVESTVTPAVIVQLDDPDSERVRSNHEQRLTELARLPLASAIVLPGVVLADGVETAVLHGLGRLPKFLSVSVPRGGPSSGGLVQEIRASGSTHDPRQRAVLKASGWGATITVDVLIV